MNQEIIRDKKNELINIKDDLVGFTGHQTNNQHPIFYLGKGQDNKEYCDKLYNLTLVSGSTGSGMSLFLETLVLDLANRYSPDELKFILLDPGGFQYPHFAKLPHLISPIMTDMADSKYVFAWLVSEIQRRYDLLIENKMRYTEQYNEKYPENKLPHIVLISYQFAESLVTDPESIEKSVIRLAQLNKSAGIYPILVSSRPSNNIFTGLIKANTTAFVSFSLASEKDSQDFIGIPDAKDLKGKGDMLYIRGGLDPIRIQAEYLPHEEIGRNIENMANKYPQDYDKGLMGALLNKTELKLASEEPVDDLVEDAKQIVAEEGSASASLLQRKLQIGYARAARLLDKLEEDKLDRPTEDSKSSIMDIENNMDQINLKSQEKRIANFNEKKKLVKRAREKVFYLDLIAVFIISLLLTNFSYKSIYGVVIFIFIRYIVLDYFDKHPIDEENNN
ncbi:MAG: FtsK/SpoIIIE domain-containing protein [Candidatus Pacearchaeota archaeon]